LVRIDHGLINIITTILNMRAPGMTLMKMPMFVWTWLITPISGAGDAGAGRRGHHAALIATGTNAF
jgi:hypothetical protein